MRRPWLVPLVPLYAAGLALRNLRLRRGSKSERKLTWPVISIGNLSTGGSGKTPLAVTLAKLLKERGIHVDVLSRGYGRMSRESARVDSNGTADQYGDEPLLIARDAGVPVYVAVQRYDAGMLAEASGSENASGQRDTSRGPITFAHILDDGFQHRQLHRIVDILLLNREDWEDTLLPAGNLREPLRAVMRAHVVAIPADDPSLGAELRRWGWAGPLWLLRRIADVPKVEGPVIAFCGIARPEQFFSGLEGAGLYLASRHAFRDHHHYTRGDLDKLFAAARVAKAAALITTEKDAVRLGSLASACSPDLPLQIAKLRTEIESADAAINWLVARLAAGESSHPV